MQKRVASTKKAVSFRAKREKKKSSGEEATGEEGSSAEFFEEIRKLLADFNVSIQEESKDRKLRFHVKPAHQVPSAAGRGCG